MKLRVLIILTAVTAVVVLVFVSLIPSQPVALPSASPQTGSPSASSPGDFPHARSHSLSAVKKPTREDTTHRLEVAIQRALSSASDADREIIFTELLPALIALNPAAAARLAESAEPSQQRTDLLQQVARAWAAADSKAALGWAENLSIPNERVSALTEACLQIAQSEPAQAMAAVERFEIGDSYSTLQNVVQLWVEKDLPAATEWVRQQPEGEQRDLAIAPIVLKQAQTDPGGAVEFLLEYMTPGDGQEEAAISVLHQWALRDFTGASNWVAMFPEGPLRARALKELSGVQGVRIAK